MLRLLVLILFPVLSFGQLKDTTGFLNKIASIESKGNYNVVGGASGKYFGKYQFSNIALREIGWGHITVSKFKVNKSVFPPEKQEQAMILLLDRYRYYLSKEISRYSENYFNSIHVSTAGILAAVHAVGFSEVKAYFKNCSSKTKVVERYLRLFSEY